MTWTAWNNGSHHQSGAGYGFKIEAPDRDRHFRRQWGSALIHLPHGAEIVTAEVNVDKDSFWGPSCRELVSQLIGRWLLAEGHAPWPKGLPPKFRVQRAGARTFVVVGLAA